MRPLTPIASLHVVALAFLAASLAVPASAFAQGPGPGPGAAQKRFPPGLAEAPLIVKNAEKLGVDAETVAKIEKMTEESRRQDEKQREEMRAAWEKLREMFEQPLPDEKALVAQAGKVSNLWSEMHERRVRMTYRVRALLTEEQREKFMKLRGEARPMFPGGAGMRRGGPGRGPGPHRGPDAQPE